MKEKITKLKDWYNSLNSTKQKLVKYGVIAFLSSFLGGYFAESAYRVSTNGLLGADNTSINFLLCPIYALIRANGLIYTLIITLAISGFLFIMEFRNQDLAKEAHEDDRGVAVAANPLYGSADWMQPEEIHKHFEIGPVKDVEGIILGQLDKEGKEAICLANNSPGNRNIMIFGSPVPVSPTALFGLLYSSQLRTKPQWSLLTPRAKFTMICASSFWITDTK